MSVQLKLDEMLDILVDAENPQARFYETLLCTVGTEMARAIAAGTDTESGDATMQGMAFAGICAPFNPGFFGQLIPEQFAAFDNVVSDWEYAASNLLLPTGPGQEPKPTEVILKRLRDVLDEHSGAPFEIEYSFSERLLPATETAALSEVDEEGMIVDDGKGPYHISFEDLSFLRIKEENE